MRIRDLSVSGLAAVALVFASIPGCNVESVDYGPAVAVATAYYQHLSASDVHAALALFLLNPRAFSGAKFQRL